LIAHDNEYAEYHHIVLPLAALLPAAYLPSGVLRISAPSVFAPAIAIQEEIVSTYFSLEQARRTLRQVPEDFSCGISTMCKRAERLRMAAVDNFRTVRPEVLPWKNARAELLPSAIKAGKALVESAAQAALRLAARLHISMRESFPSHPHDGPSLEFIGERMSLRLDELRAEGVTLAAYSAEEALLESEDVESEDVGTAD
jgi:hypothetical protein